MTMTHTETLSAVLDGEPVDVALLAAALDHPEGRAILVDFVRLREAARADREPLPDSLARARSAFFSRGLLRWTAAAAVLLLMFIAGLVTPLPGRTSAANPDAPPIPTRIETFQPGVDWHSGD